MQTKDDFSSKKSQYLSLTGLRSPSEESCQTKKSDMISAGKIQASKVSEMFETGFTEKCY